MVWMTKYDTAPGYGCVGVAATGHWWRCSSCQSCSTPTNLLTISGWASLEGLSNFANLLPL